MFNRIREAQLLHTNSPLFKILLHKAIQLKIGNTIILFLSSTTRSEDEPQLGQINKSYIFKFLFLRFCEYNQRLAIR